MISQDATEARRLYNEAKREHDIAVEKKAKARRLMDAAWTTYLMACQVAGYCGTCEKPTSECVCVPAGRSS